MAVDIYWELKSVTHGTQMLKITASEVVSRSGSSTFAVLWQDPFFSLKEECKL